MKIEAKTEGSGVDVQVELDPDTTWEDIVGCLSGPIASVIGTLWEDGSARAAAPDLEDREAFIEAVLADIGYAVGKYIGAGPKEHEVMYEEMN